MTALTPEQIDFVIRQVSLWVRTCEDNGRGICTPDVSHSSLLHRLLSGRPLLEKPPPRAFSYPCYEMVEQEEVKIHDFWEMNRDYIFEGGQRISVTPPVVCIDQSPSYVWDDKEQRIIRHVPSGLRWQLHERRVVPAVVPPRNPEDHAYMGKFLRRLPCQP